MALCKNKIDVESQRARGRLEIQTKKLNEKRRVFHRLEEGNPLSHQRQFVLVRATKQYLISGKRVERDANYLTCFSSEW